MTSKSKRKGTRIENQIVELLTQAEIPAERVPLSGSMGGKYSGDVVIGSIEDVVFRCEVKGRKDGKGFTVIERWLGDKDILFLKRNYQTPLVVMDMGTFVELLIDYIQTSQEQENES